MPDWLSLDEAAKRLNVHPSTLRDWSDRGRIRAIRTPGGHRRFSELDVVALATETKPDLSLLMHATVGHARIASTEGRLQAEAWYSRFDEAAKIRQRELGLELVQVLTAYLGDEQREWSSEMTSLGDRYASLAREAGLSLGDAMRAFHLFEGLVRESVSELSAARIARSDLDHRVGWFLNEVRVAMAESLQQGGGVQ